MSKEEALAILNKEETLAEVAFYAFTEEDDDSGNVRALAEYGIKSVAVEGYTQEIGEVMEDSYGSLAIAVVVSIGDYYFKSDGFYTSYGAVDFEPWYEVLKKFKKIIQITYEPKDNRKV